MRIIALINILLTVGVLGLILHTTIKALQNRSLAKKRNHLKLVLDQYREEAVLKKQHKNANQKEKQNK